MYTSIGITISDIKDRINALNQQIFQTAASLQDSVIHTEYEFAEGEMEAAFADVCRTVSEPLAQLLVRKGQKPVPLVNPLMVQVILEMYLIFDEVVSLSSSSSTFSDILLALPEGPTTSGSSRQTKLTRARKVIWRDEFMMGFYNIVRISKWEIGIRTPEDLTAFKQNLFAIFETVEDLAEMVALISDLEVNVARSFVPFDHRRMQDVYGETPPQGHSSKSDEVVAGTTGIGLNKVILSPSGDKISKSIIAPEVILVSTLRREGLLPPPSLLARSKKGLDWGEGDQGRGVSSPSEFKTLPLPPQPLDKCRDLGLSKIPPPTATNDESLLAARAILDGTGASPVMAVIDTMLALRKEITKVSNFLVENIRHASYELFQEELDRCYYDSERTIGKCLSKFLREHSETEEPGQSLINIMIQIFIVSFCAFEWKDYLDTPLDVVTHHNPHKNAKEQKTAFLRNLSCVFKIAGWAIPGSANRVAFEESLNPFFVSMEETEAAWKQLPEYAKASLSIVSPGDNLADEADEDGTKIGIQISNGQSPMRNIVLGTTALGVRCRFQNHVTGAYEDKPRTLLPVEVIMESSLRYTFGIQEEREPTTGQRRVARSYEAELE